ncbi:MAG: hypothetical protein ACK5KL_06650 [Dysgonomonas sp.]
MTDLQIVDINDLATSEYDHFKYVEYNGKPFTEKETYRCGSNYEYNLEAYSFFQEVGDRNRVAGLKLWLKMLDENIYTKYTAIKYAGENKMRETVSYLRTDNHLPEKIHRDGGGGTSYLYSIAQEGEMAIEKIEGKNDFLTWE